MPSRDSEDFEAGSFETDTFESRMNRYETSREWKRKSLRFLRYLSTRQMECWGFFAAGVLIGKIIL